MTTEEGKTLDKNIPQWKKDLILRRRAVGRVLPTGSGSVQLTCPSVVAAVRFAEYSVNSDFLRRCESEREQTGSCKNMRLVEQVSASDGFFEPCVIFDVKEIITKIESGSTKNSIMGEEKNEKTVTNVPFGTTKKLIDEDFDDNASDSSEEFKYGPGIVSKLKSKYLSLTLRESQGRIRPSLINLRRATSLENILDGPETERAGECKSNYLKNAYPNGNADTPPRCRGLSRINKESMKRARSVEVLTRCDRVNRRSFGEDSKEGLVETIERRKDRHRIINSSVEETELPPPDLVKHTLKIFESSHNVKIPSNIKNKNQMNNSVCAKKPSACLKPPKLKQKGVDKQFKCDINSSANDISKKFNGNVKNLGCSTVYGSVPVENRKSDLLKDTNETVINKAIDEEQKIKKASSQLKENLSLDLTDAVFTNINKQNTSPVTLTSPKSNRLSESPEPKRCISPVLVRAPPCILSSELNSNNSPSQHVKQVGVIRPIVTNKTINSKSSINKSQLTEQEIEKNLINKVKSIEQPVAKVIVSLKKSPEECFISKDANRDNDSIKRGQFWDKKPNTMVFNFSNRKTIPDYIENDGLILTPKKDKPKLEAGIILLRGSTEDSSTDFEPDDLSSDPPEPCDVVFEGDNVLINGKSNIQSKPKPRKMKIQFNDEATTLFEYPSEASLLIDQEEVNGGQTFSTENGPDLPNPFRCSTLASYTPSKVALSTDFQLGITKTPQLTPSPPTETTELAEEVEEYLRPADENSTVSWSAETTADLLF